MAYVEFENSNAGTTANALYELGLVYATGRGGEELDMVAAHKWFNLAAHRGSDLAKLRREEIAVEMSMAEIRQAQRAAREWLTRH